jgi:hypothetical protein
VHVEGVHLGDDDVRNWVIWQRLPDSRSANFKGIRGSRTQS